MTVEYNSRMHKLVVLYPPPVDPAAFRDYYESTHVPLAQTLPGLRSYQYAFDVGSPAGDSPYFCIFEAEFDDAAALGAAMGSPEGQTVAADVPNYATGGATMLTFDVAGGSPAD
ncbi:MAG: Ethyl tert-butyl ether degradation EthD [Solirubrobacterales bacterium]|nr:Ethyl tert-butyl ether degradation EthD [Solirubrobacterales bacterium]